MRLITTLFAATLWTACGSTAPTVPVDPTESVQQMGKQIDYAQASSRQVTESLARQIGGLQHDVQLAAQKSEMAVEAVEREARKKPQTVVQEKLVPVLDPTFSKQDRADLLSRAEAQVAKLREAAAQLHDLSAKLNQLQDEVAGLREFRESPSTFVKTHGVSGVLMLILSTAAYALGIKRRK